MKKNVKLALRASEIRSEIKRLDPGGDTLAKRRELLGQWTPWRWNIRPSGLPRPGKRSSAASPTGSPPRNASGANWRTGRKFRNALHVVVIDRALTDATGAGGIKRRDSGEGIGKELESLAVLDRRIAKIRSRIAWSEAAANGNILPRMETW